MDNNLTPIEICDKMASCLNEMAEAKGVARCGFIYAMAQLIELMKDQLQAGAPANDRGEQSCTTEHIPSPSETEP